MNLEFDAEQELVVDNAAQVFEQLDSLGRYRADDVASLWKDLVGAGWSDLGEPIESGLLDLGTALGIFRAAGRHLIVEDLTTSSYLLPTLFTHCTQSGELFAAALSESPGALLDESRLCFTSSDHPTVFRVAEEPDGVPRLAMLSGAEVTTRRVGHGLSFNKRHVDVAGGTWIDSPLDIDASDLRRIEATAALLHSAGRVGLAERALDMTRQHALSRYQFDVPIGSFQAVKHLLADSLAMNEVAWSAALCAAAAPSEYRNLVARLLCLDAAMTSSRAAAQVHGGFGFTWESDLHFVLKAILDSSTRFGSADELSLAVADLFVGMSEQS